MFTGLVEEIGSLIQSREIGSGRRLKIHCSKILEDVAIDDSIAVSGACLTVVAVGDNFFEADAVAETIKRTNLKLLKAGDKVNLERALRPSDRLGGHFMQGHVDGTGQIVHFKHESNNTLLTVQISPELEKFVIPKGSITIDGISLTIAALEGTRVTLAIIPHTVQQTTLQYRRAGHIVNIEVDLIGKYIYKFFEKGHGTSKLSVDWLKEQGFA